MRYRYQSIEELLPFSLVTFPAPKYLHLLISFPLHHLHWEFQFYPGTQSGSHRYHQITDTKLRLLRKKNQNMKFPKIIYHTYNVNNLRIKRLLTILYIQGFKKTPLFCMCSVT